MISTVGEICKNDDSLIILGNGPSLLDSMTQFEDILKERDCIVVNHFCETDYYTQIKPRFYLLADPAYFGDIDTYADWLKIKIQRFTDVFLRKTTWNVSLILPSFAFGSKFVECISQNSFIHVFYYNTDNMNNDDKYTKFELWDKNLIAPPAQTCLNTCVWLGIFLRYKSLYLIGADTSWIELLRVDQETNELYTIDSHFYGTKKMVLYADVEGKVPQKLHENLNCISRALSLYWDLRNYSDFAGVNVYNASSYSLIDAFERKTEIG